VASGKSTVAGLFQECGATVLDADRLAHECLDDPTVRAEIATRFGGAVLSPDGSVDRAALAKIVFDDPASRQQLEALIHPRVAAALQTEIARIDALGRRQLVVLDVPLLLESGLDALCDHVVFVDAPDHLRQERAVKERGWAPGEVARREKNQESTKRKKARADSMIQNLGSIEPLRTQVRELQQKILNEQA
jgi:dephospho-CoA kinase